MVASSAASVPPLRPFLKWAAGKTRLLPKFVPYLPASFDSYHDLDGVPVNVWQQQGPSRLHDALAYFKALILAGPPA